MGKRKSKSNKNGKKNDFVPVKAHLKKPRQPAAASLKNPHVNNLRHRQGPDTRVPVKQLKNTWNPNMPRKTVEYKDTPWYTSSSGGSTEDHYQQQQETFPKRKSNVQFPIDNVSEASLARLDQEMFNFSTYVELTRQEEEAREYVIQHVTDTAGSLFGKKDTSTAIRVSAFGSYATPEVCTFASDVDLALWGVVPVDVPKVAVEHKYATRNRESPANNHSEQQQQQQQEMPPSQKWKEALAEFDAVEQRQENTQADTANSVVEQPVETETQPDLGDSQQERDMLFVIDRNGDGDVLNASDETIEASNKDSQARFVMDRQGDGEPSQAEDHEYTKESEPSKSRQEGDASEQGHMDGDADGDQCSRKPQPLQLAKAVDSREDASQDNGTAADASLVVEAQQSDQSVIDLCASDSDADTADKLESYDNKPHDNGEAHTVRHSTTTDSDSDGQFCDAPEEDDLEVSIVAHPSPPRAKSQFGPIGQARNMVVRSLKALGRALWKSPVTHTVDVRKFARVPIVSTGTHLGFECDIAIGGHNGTDTSRYAYCQVQRFKSFAPVVRLLKVMLNQQALDKPFNGGLGSYKLYVLVANHIEQHIALGGVDRPSEVLLTFFYRFRNWGGKRGRQQHERSKKSLETVLSQNSIIRCDGGQAELQAVFKAQHCCKLFEMSWSRLMESLLSEDCAVSPLARIVNSMLAVERNVAHKKASKLNEYMRGPSSRSGKTAKAAHVFSKSSVAEGTTESKEAAIANDAGEDELLAGYGMKRGPNGGLVPRDGGVQTKKTAAKAKEGGKNKSTSKKKAGKNKNTGKKEAAPKKKKNKKKQKRASESKEQIAAKAARAHKASQTERRMAYDGVKRDSNGCLILQERPGARQSAVKAFSVIREVQERFEENKKRKLLALEESSKA